MCVCGTPSRVLRTCTAPFPLASVHPSLTASKLPRDPIRYHRLSFPSVAAHGIPVSLSGGRGVLCVMCVEGEAGSRLGERTACEGPGMGW